MVLLYGSPDQQAMYHRLRLGAEQRQVGDWSCSVQGGPRAFLVIISDQKTREVLWEGAGTADQIAPAFEAWLNERGA